MVITTGGTGVTGRDVTPEALAQVAEKHIAGFGELFRMLSYAKIGTSSLQSRADAARRRRHLHLLPAGLARRLPRRLGRDPGLSARYPPPPLQFRRAPAAAARARAAGAEPSPAVWFTADTHFGHGGALGLFRRPFASVAAMDAALIERWNATVAAEDTVWHLGDFAVRVREARAAALLAACTAPST